MGRRPRAADDARAGARLKAMNSELSTLADIAEIIGAIFVIGGIIFAVIQVRQFRRQRLEMAAFELVGSFRNSEFTRALTFVLSLPNGIPANELRARAPDAETLAMVASTTLESVGLMVYRRILPIALVDELIGGTVVTLWAKLGGWVAALRQEENRTDTHEWFEWLAERLNERAASTNPESVVAKRARWKE